MSKKKLQRFDEMKTFSNVHQPPFMEVFQKDHHLKGKWKSGYFENRNPLVLELGCGKGEYTTGLARIFADRNYIGIDIKGSRIWKGARAALQENLGNVAFIRTYIETINSFFEPGEVDEIWLTFPDPQLKKKNKRLTAPRFLNRYRQFLKDGGLVHLKTDNPLLYQYTMKVAGFNKLTLQAATDDLYHSDLKDRVPDIKTFYEQQFLDQGMKINYLCFKLPNEKNILEPPDE
jgi:tRNA (guanine-N7-)-methyltransferase